MSSFHRKPYSGTETSLVIGIDVGTTFSGVSYALLQPGRVPQINPVVRFPGQTQTKGYAKVPSVVWYDQYGKVIAVGSQADPDVNPLLYKANGIRRAEWFKLRLRPPHLAADKQAQLEKIWSPPEPAEGIDHYADAANEEENENDTLLVFEGAGGVVEEPEPQNKKKIPRLVTDDFKTPLQVFADFLRYILKAAKEYISETESHIDPTFTWSSIERKTYFVLTHPNGWEGKQQSQMREAAVAAGLVDRSTAGDRIVFATEGEASLHFCLDKDPELHKERDGLLVVDCGGGTIDLSAYSKTEKGGYKEIVSSDCLLQGSIFVTSRARDYFKGKFKDSKFGTDDEIEAMAKVFDRPSGAKCLFSDPTAPYVVKFGGLRDNDQKYGIARGKFDVDGAQMAKIFEPAVQDIIKGIKIQCKNIKDGSLIKRILLVGGFGGSPYLYAKLHDYFKSRGIVVLRPDNGYSNDLKAVAHGSVSYYIDHCVSARIAKYAYGVKANIPFNSGDIAHVRRQSEKYTDPSGTLCIGGVFSPILAKGTTVTEETQFRNSYQTLRTPVEFSRWSMFSIPIRCYNGPATNPPQWLDLEPDAFRQLCIINANMTKVKANLSPRYYKMRQFYQFDFEVVILFGLTELKAYIAWEENGKELRSDAVIIYD